ncbi:hypothetical protein [Flavobacterium difficile]|nr:hypothetical protein [Flavobacterium difficile]
MKIAIMTSLLAEWDVDVYAAHLKVFSGQFLVFSLELDKIKTIF